MKYNNLQDLVKNAPQQLSLTELTFTSVYKGVFEYKGTYLGQSIHCSVSEVCLSDITFSSKENISSLVQSEYVTLILNNETILVV